MEREPGRESIGKPDKTPLFMKLYFHEVYTEVARIVGYAGFPRDQLENKMNDLVERFGRKKIQDVCGELITLRFKGKEKQSGRKEDAEVQLKEDVRKLCWQLLGPPPDKKAEFERNLVVAPPAAQEAAATAATEPPTPAKAPRPKKKRMKKADSRPGAEPDAAESLPVSPVMQQYRQAKEKHPGMMLLFRIGDFYELFGEDAETAHKLLGLTLTTRDQTHTMAGFPHHQLETYLHKLLKEGQRVAICEPVEESLARGPIQREVQRVVVPGEDEEPA